MASWMSLALFVAAAMVAATEARAIPAEPVSLMMDSYGNPVLFLREKRAPANPYPQRAMMFTGYYRPVRRTNEEGQATGVFAQGNAVSGGAYLGESEPTYLQRGPEPNEEPEVSSAEAEAAPNPLEQHVDEEEQNEPAQGEQNDQQDTKIAQEEEQQQDQEQEAPVAADPAVESAPAPVRPARKQGPKKSKKKTPVQFEAEEDEDESEDIEDDDDEPASPFVPFKSNGRRPGQVPNLNNFFPMVFSFPRGNARGGASSGSPPGMITAIANSYSTSKGGVASSVATAYGGSPQSKKSRRAQPAQE